MDFEAQKIIYNAIKNISVEVYDEPVPNKTYPYVVIGGGGSTPFQKHGKDGIENNFLITIYTKSSSLGFYPALMIAAEIKSILHMKRFETNNVNYRNVICKQISQDRERDGEYRNIDLRYQILIEEV
jgi:hypothetical protein